MKIQVSNNGEGKIKVDVRVPEGLTSDSVLVMEPGTTDDFTSAMTAATIMTAQGEDEGALLVEVSNCGLLPIRVREEGKDFGPRATAENVVEVDESKVFECAAGAALLVEELQPEVPDVHGGA